MTENWVRVIEENGFYVTTKITNVEKFLNSLLQVETEAERFLMFQKLQNF